MSKGRVSALNFDKEIAKELEEYKGDVSDIVETALSLSLQHGVRELKNNSPKDTGQYAKQWKSEKIKTGRTINGTQMQGVLYNNVYMLTHLLEFGHANRNGGRTPGKKHIAPAAESASKMFEREIIAGLTYGNS